MKRGECAKLAQRAVKRLADLAGVGDWRIELVVGRCSSDEAVAEVVVQGEYKRADLTLDHHKLDGEEELVQALAHEVLHIAHYPLELLAPIVYAAISDDAPALRRTIEIALTQAIERSVVNLEPLLVSAYYERWGRG